MRHVISRVVSTLSTSSSLIVGSLLLIAALVLYLVHGVLLMGYEDKGYGDEWNWAQGNVRLASLSPGFRTALWVTAIGAPAALVTGAALTAVGTFRASRGRAAAQRALAAGARRSSRG